MIVILVVITAVENFAVPSSHVPSFPGGDSTHANWSNFADNRPKRSSRLFVGPSTILLGNSSRVVTTSSLAVTIGDHALSMHTFFASYMITVNTSLVFRLAFGFWWQPAGMG